MNMNKQYSVFINNMKKLLNKCKSMHFTYYISFVVLIAITYALIKRIWCNQTITEGFQAGLGLDIRNLYDFLYGLSGVSPSFKAW